VGVFSPEMIEVAQLSAGEVGFVIAGIKDVADAKVGDTITLFHNRCEVPLDGFKEVKPMVFSGLYPIDTSQYEQLRDALAKLKLNDSSFPLNPKHRLLWDSASVVVSLACCIWRSSRSVWSGSFTLI